MAVLGLVMVFAVYFALGALPQELKDMGVVRALRYAALVLVATEGVPLALRRWLPAQASAAQGRRRSYTDGHQTRAGQVEPAPLFSRIVVATSFRRPVRFRPALPRPVEGTP